MYCIFQQIKRLHKVFSTSKDPPDQVTEMAGKVRELEQYMTVDLERHIGVKNGQRPYYITRLFNLLQKVEELLAG